MLNVRKAEDHSSSSYWSINLASMFNCWSPGGGGLNLSSPHNNNRMSESGDSDGSENGGRNNSIMLPSSYHHHGHHGHHGHHPQFHFSPHNNNHDNNSTTNYILPPSSSSSQEEGGGLKHGNGSVGKSSFTIDSLLGTNGKNRGGKEGGGGRWNNNCESEGVVVRGRSNSRKERTSSSSSSHHPYTNHSLSMTAEKTTEKPRTSRRSSKSKRVRTIFTPEQLERLEAEFERQQYMVGPERLYLASSLYLTEAQVKVWFQNRRIKWRKQHLEMQQQRVAIFRSQASSQLDPNSVGDDDTYDGEEDSYDEEESKTEYTTVVLPPPPHSHPPPPLLSSSINNFPHQTVPNFPGNGEESITK